MFAKNNQQQYPLVPNLRDIIQIQLLTRRGQPKVYFATNVADNKPYVYKGPLSMDMVQRIYSTEQLKRLLKVPHLNVQFECVRESNHSHFDKGIWMRSDSVINYTTAVVQKESKLETRRPIYNGPKADVQFPELLPQLSDRPAEFVNLVSCLFIKILSNTNDWAARNFIVRTERIEEEKSTTIPHSYAPGTLTFYSVDDHSNQQDCDFDHLTPGMNKVAKQQWNTLLLKHKSELQQLLDQWKVLLKDQPQLLTKINKIQCHLR